MGGINQTADNIREAVFGANDGVVSTFGILSGLVGAALHSPTIIVVGLVQLFAAGMSMGLGAYISTKSENEVLHAQMHAQADAINKHPKVERQKVHQVLYQHGVGGDELDSSVKDIVANKHMWAHFLVETKLGRSPETLVHPMLSGFVMFVSFVFAGVFPLFPFFFLDAQTALAFSALLALLVLFAVGHIKTRFTKRNALLSGFENVLIGALTGVVGYTVGAVVAILA